MRAFVHAFMCAWVHLCVCAHVRACMCICVCTRPHACTCAHVHLCARAHRCIHVSAHAHARCALLCFCAPAQEVRPPVHLSNRLLAHVLMRVPTPKLACSTQRAKFHAHVHACMLALTHNGIETHRWRPCALWFCTAELQALRRHGSLSRPYYLLKTDNM